ncbi:hydroxylamine reductase [Candidatus Methanoplasma termitum]|uniref:Hydroxylamine reductase n=1 Tax=Candidatus Methanoplasma termitum TaxID=1577791 RepID=A0A0A7LF09_9ARCH|nr:hydroxylamine reductase [Candidatus Methanoplasma termitum]AIZ56912.1 hydroxylamine reductase [Candidatus Methanoplasma termitum]
MKCIQCEERIKGTGCIKKGVCGKTAETAELQDLLIYSLKGLAIATKQAKDKGKNVDKQMEHIADGLFSTLTNVNFNEEYFIAMIDKSKKLINDLGGLFKNPKYDIDCADYDYVEKKEKAKTVGIETLSSNEDLSTLKQLLLYGLKGLGAYYHHARVLGYTDKSVEDFMVKGLIALTKDLSADELLPLVLGCGEAGVTCMALLDKANTETYGTPEITNVSLKVRNKPGILITGHDLKDLEMLLEQTKGTGIDVYTHGEMLPANAYPKFKKYDNLVGNYGNAWQKQKEEFASFNGPILVTTNCLVPPADTYSKRLFTTGLAGFSGIEHIPEKNGKKDFSKIVALAKTCQPPKPIDDMTIPIGFAHGTVLSVADKVLAAISSGALKRLVVMAGCDGRSPDRKYYTQFAEALPKDTIILTAGCAKYKYNKLALGDIGGIPRVLDAGQCNDCYSLVVVALKLAEVTGLSVNELPLSFNIAWYEQKACLVLLSLLHLGVKDIMLGPSLPGFISPNILKVLVDTFGLKANSTVKADMKILKIEG